MKRLITILFSGILALGVFGCEADNTINDILQNLDTTPACTKSADSVKAACEGYRDTLCARHITCSTFADMAECNTWWLDNYGDCATAPTDVQLTDVEAANYSTCLCELPDANCISLRDNGAEVTLPACDEF